MTVEMLEENAHQIPSPDKKLLLHVSTRDVLRPIRDQVLRLAGFDVISASNYEEGLMAFGRHDFDLVLVDVDGETEVGAAEALCSEVKTARHHQRVAFVCNWRVGNLTDCPDEILRTEFDPAAFVAGVSRTVA